MVCLASVDIRFCCRRKIEVQFSTYFTKCVEAEKTISRPDLLPSLLRLCEILCAYGSDSIAHRWRHLFVSSCPTVSLYLLNHLVCCCRDWYREFNVPKPPFDYERRRGEMLQKFWPSGVLPRAPESQLKGLQHFRLCGFTQTMISIPCIY